jgi:multidrug resistance efflux pump
VSDPSANHETRQAASAGSNAAPRPLSLSDRVRSLRLPDRPANSSARRTWIPWLLCGLLAVSTGYLLLAQPQAKSANPEENPSSAGQATPSTGIAPQTPGSIILETKGYIMATHPYKVGPNQVGSKIKWLHKRVLEGQWFTKGDVLAKLDDTEYLQKKKQAEGDCEAAIFEVKAARERLKVATSNLKEIPQARAELGEAKAFLKKLEVDLVRQEELQNTRAVAKRDYEDVKYSCDAQRRRVEMLTEKYNVARETRQEMKQEAEANLKKAEANLKKAEANLEEANWRWENCSICAPSDGTILKKYVELEDPLDARAFNLAAILCDMADLRDLEVELSVQEREIARIVEGQDCLVRPETYPDKAFKGVVSRKMPNADRSKGAVPVRVKVLDIPNNNQDKYLIPDGGAIVTFLETPREKRLKNLRHLSDSATSPPGRPAKLVSGK